MPTSKEGPDSPSSNPNPGLSRRTFLGLSGIAAAWYLARPFIPLPNKAVTRTEQWPLKGLPNLIEWRYVAGRIIDDAQDFGFILSMSDIRAPGLESQQMLVQRKDLGGDQAFAETVYVGELKYDESSATYTFSKDGLELATWRWNENDGLYELSVDTAELTLTDVKLKPHPPLGDLIAEGGDGDIQVGRVAGIRIESDYHADWAAIELAGQDKGTARIDMQGLRPAVGLAIAQSGNYAHHWFAIAVALDDGAAAWISTWRIEDPDGPFWVTTIATGSDETWKIEKSLTEEEGLTPLEVEILEWQNLPEAAGPNRRTGRKWRLTGPDNSLDLEIEVPPGQFTTSNPFADVGGSPSFMQEANGTKVTGTVLGKSITSVSLAVAESTADFEFYPTFMPVVRN